MTYRFKVVGNHISINIIRSQLGSRCTGKLLQQVQQQASVPMTPNRTRCRIGRDRNIVRFHKWCVYIKDEGPINGEGPFLQRTLDKLKDVKTRTARVPGLPNQPLVLTKVSKNKVEVTWPFPVSADTCVRVVKLALGNNWRSFVTDPAGVQGAHQEAATAEDGAVAAEATLFDDASSRGASAADPFSPLPPFSGPTVASSAATAEARSGVNLLTLKLEAITTLGAVSRTCNRLTP